MHSDTTYLTFFPSVRWDDVEATFLQWGAALPEAPTTAAVVFAFVGERIAAADIVGRGWCVPSGRLEPGETAEQAARREAWEEAGLTLGVLRPLGTYVLRTDDWTRLAPAFLAEVLQTAPAPPPGTESRGVRLLSIEEAPALYYRWDPLIAAVFDLASAAARENRGA